tara:strand:+ start:144 stop:1052 length:909 start_codon:yes stop_codon:yes gene_type:complete
MLYQLRIHAIGKYPEIEIDEKKYYSIYEARNILSAAMAVEEKYELLINNYVELEKEVLSAATDNMIYRDKDYSGFFDIRLLFNQRLVNLLTSCRLYLDQIQQHIKTCLPNDLKKSNQVKELFSVQYDSHFEYQFMEALRNYVQHRGLAVHSTAHSSRWTSTKDDGLMEFGIKLFTHKSEVEHDKAFKKSVSKVMDEKIELITTSRRYIECLNHCHIQIRELISHEVKAAREVIENIIREYGKINNGETDCLTALKFEESSPCNILLDEIPILLEWDNVREGLVKKNQKLTNLYRRYVSGNSL